MIVRNTKQAKGDLTSFGNPQHQETTLLTQTLHVKEDKEQMVFTVTSSNCKVEIARFYEFLFTLG